MCNYLVDKSRIDVLPEIAGNFETLYNEKNGIEKVEVKSACQLEEDQMKQIAASVQEKTGAKQVHIKPIIDEELIGGFVVSYGGQKIDLSIRAGLEAVRRELSSVS